MDETPPQPAAAEEQVSTQEMHDEMQNEQVSDATNNETPLMDDAPQTSSTEQQNDAPDETTQETIEKTMDENVVNAEPPQEESAPAETVAETTTADDAEAPLDSATDNAQPQVEENNQHSPEETTSDTAAQIQASEEVTEQHSDEPATEEQQQPSTSESDASPETKDQDAASAETSSPTDEVTILEKSLSTEDVAPDAPYTFTTSDPTTTETDGVQVATSLSRPDSTSVVSNTAELSALDASSPTHQSQELQPTPVQEVDVVREDLVAKIKAALEERERVKLQNAAIQHRLGEYFRKRRVEEAQASSNPSNTTSAHQESEDKNTSDQTQRYMNCLTALRKLQNDHATLITSNHTAIKELKTKLADKITEAKVRQEEYVAYRNQIIREAENSKTGKALPAKVIEQLEIAEEKKDKEVIHVRLENIKLRNKLKRAEAMIRQKEELAEGLHLIDFEQLKIENQTFNEKIEERSEELVKLRKKITNIVQVLTHVKEKLFFVQNETIYLKEALQKLDNQVTKQRDYLPTLKARRDSLKSENTELKQRNGLLGNKKLLRDYERRADSAAELDDRLRNLREQHKAMSNEIKDLRRRIAKGQLDWIY